MKADCEILQKINFPDDIKKLSIDELNTLAKEIRQKIIKVVSKNGGHLASNLGVVELTLALHYVFSMPYDKIIWDVGHQTYVHKIVTGRKDNFDTIRRYKGLSGFPKKSESIYDCFDTGHSSTSISAALGMALARDLKGEDYSVIAVIGDGALTGGMAFEALNNIGHLKTKIIVVLNDNSMSISENVGSLSLYLSKLRTAESYYKFKSNVNKILDKMDGSGEFIKKLIEKTKLSIKNFIVPGMLFEELGLTYLGPIDGHDIGAIIDILRSAKKINGPVLVHVKTKKGKGYFFAEENPDKFHSIGPFDINTGEANSNFISFTDVFSETICELAEKDKRIVAITAAMSMGTGLLEFSKKYPDRFFDVGIAEEHAVTLAAGLAANGMKPVFAVYSTFLQRSYDQIIHDVCLQNLPVIFAIDRAGLVGEDGETHHGVFDISYLRHIPNMIVMAPKDGDELKMMLKLAFKLNKPTAIRYPKGYCVYSNKQLNLEFGRAEVIKEGEDLLILTCGRLVYTALEVADKLLNLGINAGIINVRFIKPLDEKLILKYIQKIGNAVVIEENVIQGGLGSSVLEMLQNYKLFNIPVKLIGVPDRFITHGKIDELFRLCRLDSESLTFSIKEFYETSKNDIKIAEEGKI